MPSATPRCTWPWALARSAGDRRVVELLLAAGADARARNLFDKTPLDYSLRGGTSAYNLSIVSLLIKAAR